MYLLMAFNAGSSDVLTSITISCATMLRVSLIFMKYSLKHSLICLSSDSISPFSTSMIFLLPSLSENNGLKVFQNVSPFPTLNGSKLIRSSASRENYQGVSLNTRSLEISEKLLAAIRNLFVYCSMCICNAACVLHG